ncbi:hypothetical protein [Burkholderia pseudomultivorans]|uniref:hypothetical protein n=1 Tax=Burkholderia pseudomultivorans TaxID=1207504 RepID=UPI0015813D40|nr:hypothetical protein [Burkholderia pseudomultivorans]
MLQRSTPTGVVPVRSSRALRVFRSVHLDDCSRFFLLRTLRRDNTNNDTSMQDGMENPT